ncbi:MAG: carboxypeptidase regulatory-like domain-containing protein [Gammaproteobacteria bacterium]
MANLRDRLRSVDRADMTLVVVLLLVYALTLWFHLDDRQENLPPLVRIGTSEESGISATPDPQAPKPEVPVQSRPDAGSEPEPSISRDITPARDEVPLPPGADDAGSLYEQSDMVQAPPETPASTQAGGPDGDLAISGRVLDRSGAPIAGITVVARAYNLFDRDSRRLIPVKGYQRETTSGYDGKYAFEQLADGEYRLNTVATKTYPKTQISVRAGVDFADIILTGQLELRVHGVITRVDGDPLESVRVSPVVLEAPAVFSNKAGRYAFKVKVRDTFSSLTVRASKSGYEEQVVDDYEEYAYNIYYEETDTRGSAGR